MFKLNITDICCGINKTQRCLIHPFGLPVLGKEQKMKDVCGVVCRGAVIFYLQKSQVPTNLLYD